MAKNWAADMRLHIKTCSNLEILSLDKHRTLMKKCVSTAHVELNRSDTMEIMEKIVEEAFERLQPVFARKVKFLELMITKGEGYIEWAIRINQ
jgi:hypothetical protein